MQVSFADRRLARDLSADDRIRKAYGTSASRLKMRLDLLAVAPSLADVSSKPPPRRHLLGGDYQGHFAIDVTANLRIVFRPEHDPVPLCTDGSIDVASVTAITIVAVVDYH